MQLLFIRIAHANKRLFIFSIDNCLLVLGLVLGLSITAVVAIQLFVVEQRLNCALTASAWNVVFVTSA